MGRVIVGICIGQAVDSLPLLTRHGKLRSQATRISQVMILARATEISRCIRQGCAHPVRIPMFCHAQWHLHRSRPRLPHRDSPHGRGSSVSRRKLAEPARLPPERSELSANSAVRRGTEALRTAREIRRAVFPGIPSPIRHSWSFWLVVGQGARYANTP